MATHSAPAPDGPVSFRGRIVEFPWEGAPEAMTLVELDIRAAISAISGKRNWWTKWHATDDTGVPIRDKWLNEFERKFIADVYERETSEWRVWWLAGAIPHVYAGFPADGSDREKQAFVDKVCSSIPYNLMWYPRPCKELYDANYYKKADPDYAAKVFATIQSETLEHFYEANEDMQSWGQIVWYFDLVELNNTLRAMPLSEWKAPMSVEVASKPAVARAIALVNAVRQGKVTKQTFREYAPDGDHRVMVVDALWFHVDRIMQELDSIRTCIINSLEQVIKENKLNTDEVEPFIGHGTAPETFFSDFLIADKLKRKFVEEVAALENVSEDEKDWHPDSNNQVLDLVHPSLYCCVFGKTKCIDSTSNDEVADASLSVPERTHRMMFSGNQLVENEHRGSAQYQWIPSDVMINDQGDATFLSYINNLHPEKHRGMYDSITAILNEFIPMFDGVLSCLRNPHGVQSKMWCTRTWSGTEFIPNHPQIPEVLNTSPSRIPYTLDGKMAQVIVKIAEIHLTPENPTYPGGSWHIEGSDAEQIVATGIYYFACENITESKLSFRVIVQEPNYSQDDTLGMKAMYGLERDMERVQSLGSITAMEDRCVVFPNTLQHRVEPFELADKTKPGVRKILAFFLVDPTKRIPSTATIPPQQADWIQGSLDPVLNHMQRSQVLVDGVVDMAVETMLGTDRGMTLTEAKEHRLRLMDERRPKDDYYCGNVPMFSLCEH